MMTLLTPGSPGFLIFCAVLLILGINLWTFAVFGIDKRRAMQGGWRVPEATLLMLAFCGGWTGAKIAQVWFRHKTRKQPFGITLNLIGVAQAGLVAAVVLTAMTPDGFGLGPLAMGFAGDASGAADRPMPRRFGPGSADSPGQGTTPL